MMRDMKKHLENVFGPDTRDGILRQFKEATLLEWNETAGRVRRAGLADENVIFDLFLSEHPDLPGEYAVFRKAELKKRREKLTHAILIGGTPVWFLLMTAVYLAVSFSTHNWRQSWLIIIAFVTVWVDTAGMLLAFEFASKRRLFHPIARVLLALAVMMTSVFVFLMGLALFDLPHVWVVFPAGVFLMLCADAVFAKRTGQKLRIINYLLYIPAAAPMLYLVLAGSGVIPWHPGWLIVPLSAVIDLGIVIGKLIDNRKYVYKPEGEDV